MRGSRDGEWTVVDWRRKARVEPSKVVSMYVSNLPEKIRKEALWKEFARFGRIVDVYMASKRDITKNRFAFVRFAAVVDAIRLESELQGIRINGKLLSVNISRFQRKEAGAGPPSRGPPPAKTPTNHTFRSSNCDGRSFASVATGSDAPRNQPPPTPPPPPPPLIHTPIPLNLSSEMASWVCDGNTLIGECISLEKLKSFPGECYSCSQIYLGGLRLGLRFNLKIDATNFLSNKNLWGA